MKSFRRPFKFIRPTQGRRGFYMIGLLMVLAIILILTGEGYFKKNAQGITQAQLYTDRSRDSACAINRNQLKTKISMDIVNNMGQVPSKYTLQAKYANNSTKCPGEGVFSVDGQGAIYCSEHAPPEGIDVTLLGG